MTSSRPTITTVCIAAGMLLAACGGSAAPASAPSSTSAAAKPSSGGAPTSAVGKAGEGAFAKPAASASGTTVRVSYNTAAATDLPFLVAEEEHYFEQEGIHPSMISMSPQVAITALSKGELDFMNSSTNSIEGAVNGLPFKEIFDSWEGAAWTLIGKKEITSVTQLRGKSVTSQLPGSAPYAYLRAGLQKYGMTPNDIQYLPSAAGTSAVFAAIIGGKVDAGVLSTPTEGQAQEQGFHEILFLGDLLDLPSNGLSTTTSYISQHRPVVVGMLRGMLKANAWIRSHPDETQKLIVDKLGTSPAVAKRTYDRMAPLLTKTGETKPDGIQQYMDLLQESTGKKSSLDPAQMADWSPLHEAQASLK